MLSAKCWSVWLGLNVLCTNFSGRKDSWFIWGDTLLQGCTQIVVSIITVVAEIVLVLMYFEILRYQLQCIKILTYPSYFQCDHCGLIMNVFECTSWVIIFFLLQNSGICLTTKRRLCVEYKKETYLEKSQHITTVHANTEGKCLASCVRRYPCMALNYHIINKTCILMRRVKCMAPTSLNNPGYLFVHLQSCKLQYGSLFVQQTMAGTGSPPMILARMLISSTSLAPSYATPAVRCTGVITSQAGGLVMERHSEPLTLLPPKLRGVRIESSWLFLTLLLFGGSRILLETRCRIALWQCRNCEMGPLSILLNITLLISKGKHGE